MEIFINILWLLIGAFFTFYAARIYYEKASEDLKKESEELKKMSQMMLQAMEHAGLAEFRKDEQGNITGLYLKFKIDSITSQSAIDHITLTKSKENK